MQSYIFRRVLLFIPTMVILSLLVFLFLRIIPGDPAELVLGGGVGGSSSFSQEDLDNVRKALGTDRPIHVQYGVWIWDVLRGDFGTSYSGNVSIGKELKDRIPLTLELSALAIAISFVLAVPLGVISALTQDTPFDYLARIVSFVGVAVPNFVVGIVTIYLLVQLFDWIPPFGYTAPWEGLGKNLEQMIFPALTLAVFMMAFIARVTRSSMLEVLREDYIRTARSKGLKERSIVFLHALKNASLPILTVTGWGFGILLGGAVIIEKIFVLPGMGAFLVDAIFSRDYPVIQAEVLVIAGMVLLVNLVIDLLYGFLDPRIRFG
jgi:peptide/nickel transport system permease protein